MKDIFFNSFFKKMPFFNKKVLSLYYQIGRLSSAGSEHLPYKQRVTGSNPVASTPKIESIKKLMLSSFMSVWCYSFLFKHSIFFAVPNKLIFVVLTIITL